MSRLVIDPTALRRLRLEAALSQRELANAAGIRAATVCDAENGRNTRPVTIRRIADALGVKPTAIARIVST